MSSIMENQFKKNNAFTVTSVFSTKEDAENAYHVLMLMGYTPEEITLIMSEDTKEKLYKHDTRMLLNSSGCFDKENSCITISDAVDTLGKYVALPGVALMVAGDFNDGGVRAVSTSVMSDKYAQYYRTRINEGEIVIDFQPHSLKERDMITGLWENYGGFSHIRRVGNAA